MTLKALSSRLAGIRHTIHRHSEREYLIFDDLYRDGDTVNGYLETIGDTPYLSDLGTTGYKIRVHGMKGRESDLGPIRIPVTPESAVIVAMAYVALCQRLYEELA